MIGAIGTNRFRDVIRFEVSPERVLTVSNFIRRNKVRFSESNILLRKPMSQYVGPALDVLDFKIILRAELGVNPQAEFNKLINIQRDGRLVAMIIGRTAFGAFRWRVDSLGIPYDDIDNTGFVRKSEVDISLKEYW